MITIAVSLFVGFLLGMFIAVMCSMSKRSELLDENRELKNLLKEYREAFGIIEVHKRGN